MCEIAGGAQPGALCNPEKWGGREASEGGEIDIHTYTYTHIYIVILICIDVQQRRG